MGIVKQTEDKKNMKILSVVGARPNFMKIAPFVHAIERYNKRHDLQGKKKIEHYLVQTGQHYDKRMSVGFFDVLNITPDLPPPAEFALKPTRQGRI